MIDVKSLYLKYIREYYALYNISFHIDKNEKVAFLGEDESGKTSMLRILAKLEKFNKGEVYIKDIELKRLNLKDDISMCYLPENPVFLKRKTVYQNFDFILKERKISEKDRVNLIDKVIIDFNIENLRDVKVEELSLFEKYKVSLIRFALRDIELALIDNIFDKLNQEELEEILNLIKTIFDKEDITLIVATTKNEIVEKLNLRTIKFTLGSIENKKK